MATDPTPATVKRLFALSGNNCAFPKCPMPLVDEPSGKVTGRICHIEAENEGGPRFNEGMTDDERRAFENLVLMCPIHHDVIDDDEASYTVERLKEIKAAHEAKNSGGREPSDAVAAQFLANIAGNSVTNGSLIFTQNQMGGQVAHSITNVGPQPRVISGPAASALIAELRKGGPEEAEITSAMGDAEALRLATQLMGILQAGGWKVDGVNQAIYSRQPTNVIVGVGSVTPPRAGLLNWLGNTGLKPTGQIEAGLIGVKIIVGSNL